MTFIDSRAKRCQHIRAAVKAAGGNRRLARQLQQLGFQIGENNIADWKRRGSVPRQYHVAVVQLSSGRLVPARIHRDAAA